MNSIQVPYLTELITKNSHPLLGVIAWTLEKDLENFWIGQFETISSDATKSIWTEYHKIFASRPDFRVWCIKINPYFSKARGWKFRRVSTEISLTWSNWYTDAHAVLTSSNDLVVTWGILSILPEIIHDEIRLDKSGWHSHLLKLINLAKKRLRDLDTLSTSPANCGAVAIIFLNKIEHLWYHLTGRDLSDEEAK
jgi:hypothetical protein